MLTLEKVVALLKARLKNKNQRQLAEELGISQAFLSDVLKGHREPGPLLLEKLGLERVTLYRRVA